MNSKDYIKFSRFWWTMIIKQIYTSHDKDNFLSIKMKWRKLGYYIRMMTHYSIVLVFCYINQLKCLERSWGHFTKTHQNIPSIRYSVTHKQMVVVFFSIPSKWKGVIITVNERIVRFLSAPIKWFSTKKRWNLWLVYTSI